MRAIGRVFLLWMTLGWTFIWPAMALADDCGSESDCSRAPNNINGATGLAAGGAAVAVGTAGAIGYRRRVRESFDDIVQEEPAGEPETFSVTWEDVLTDPEEEAESGSAAAPAESRPASRREGENEAGRAPGPRRPGGPPDGPIGQ